MHPPTGGQVAYNAYRNHTGGKSAVTRRDIPPWANLAPAIQAAWEASAAAVLDWWGENHQTGTSD